MDRPVDTSIPHDLRELLHLLYFLGMLETGQKPNFKSMTFAKATSWLDAIFRMWESEGKEGVVLRIEKITDSTIEAISRHKDMGFIDILMEALREAYIGAKTEDDVEHTGIKGLAETYKSYPDIRARLRVCTSNIELQLKHHDDAQKKKATEKKVEMKKAEEKKKAAESKRKSEDKSEPKTEPTATPFDEPKEPPEPSSEASSPKNGDAPTT
jgi:hypothetical protein